MIDYYRTLFKIYVAMMAQYRAYLVFWIFGLVIEPLVYLAVWDVVTNQGQETVSGLSQGDFSAYYITWTVVRHFALAYDTSAIQERIRTGALSPLLMRPVHSIHRDIGFNFSFQVASLPIVIIIVVLLSIVFPPTFHQTTAWQIAAFVPTVLLAAPIRFLGAYLIGLTAFWVTQMQSVALLYQTAEIFFSGRIAPLVLFPTWVLVTASVLPFRWMLAFPVEVLLGLVTPQEVVLGFGMQVIWLTIMLILLRVMWRYGIRRYSSVGA